MGGSPEDAAKFRAAFVASAKTGKPEEILGEMKTEKDLTAACVMATFASKTGSEIEEVQEAYALWLNHLGIQ